MSGISTTRVRTWRRNTGALLAAALVVVQANCCDLRGTCNMASVGRAGEPAALSSGSVIDAEAASAVYAVLPPCHRTVTSGSKPAKSAAPGVADLLQASASAAVPSADCLNCRPRIATTADSGLIASVASRPSTSLKTPAIWPGAPLLVFRPDADSSAANRRADSVPRAASRVPLYIKHLALRN